MRKVILSLAVSLDGFIASKNGGVDWLAMEDLTEAADEMNEFFASIDTVLTGRKTYEKGIEFGQDGYDGFENYIFTRNKRNSRKENIKFVSTEVWEFVENLKRQPGKDIWLTGGGELVRTFLEENLIDELILAVQSKIIGAGIPLFLPHERQLDLELLDVKKRKSGTVQIHYRIKKISD